MQVKIAKRPVTYIIMSLAKDIKYTVIEQLRPLVQMTTERYHILIPCLIHLTVLMSRDYVCVRIR